MSEIIKELGRIPVIRGEYQTGTEYYKDNIVQYKKSSYQVTAKSIINVPPITGVDTLNPGWALFAGSLDAQATVDTIKAQETSSKNSVIEETNRQIARIDTPDYDNITILNKISPNRASEGYIGISDGIIHPHAIGADTYRYVGVFIPAGTYFVQLTRPGTQAACWKYTDSTFETPIGTAIIGNKAVSEDITFEEGYYAFAWSSKDKTSKYANIPIYCVDTKDINNLLNNRITRSKLKDDIINSSKLTDELVENIEGRAGNDYINAFITDGIIVKDSEFTVGKYISPLGILYDNEEYKCTENFISVSGGQIIQLVNFAGTTGCGKVTYYDIDKNIINAETVKYHLDINISDTTNVTVPKDACFARFSYQFKVGDTVSSLTSSVIANNYLFGSNGIVKTTSDITNKLTANTYLFYSLINKDIANYGYLTIDTGVIHPTSVGNDYRYIKLYLKAGTYFAKLSVPGTQDAIWKYTDGTYTVPERKIKGGEATNGYITINEDGYYAISWNDLRIIPDNYPYPIFVDDRVIKSYINNIVYTIKINNDNLENNSVTFDKIKEADYLKDSVASATINALFNGGKILDDSNFAVGYYFDSNSSTMYSNSEYAISYYYPVIKGQNLILKNFTGSSGAAKVVYYDAQKNAIPSLNVVFDANSDKARSKVITVPQTAFFARFCWKENSNGVSHTYRASVHAENYAFNNTGFYANLANTDIIKKKYLKEDSTISDADFSYRLKKVYLKEGLYFIKMSNSHPTMAKATDSTYNTLDIVHTSSFEGLYRLEAGYYVFCWSSGTEEVVQNESSIVYVEDLAERFYSSIDTSLLTNYITVNNTVIGSYIQDGTGILESASSDYRLSKFYVGNNSQCLIKTIRTAGSHPTMWKYTNGTYNTPEKEILVGGKTYNEVKELEQGYYAVCWSDGEYPNTRVISNKAAYVVNLSNIIGSLTSYIIDHLPTSTIKDNNRISYGCLTNKDLTVNGSSTKDDNNIITLAGGSNNKAELSGGLEGAHWEFNASFRCTDTLGFTIGKAASNYGANIKVYNESGVGKIALYNDCGPSQDKEPSRVDDLGFNLNLNEDYTIKLYFNVDPYNGYKRYGVELIGQFNEYFQIDYNNTTNGYGVPFFFSDGTCIVKHSEITLSNFYDLQSAKCAVWGHSYVEGDTLGSDRMYTFTNLLAKEIGLDKVLNLGLGGDTISGILNKMKNEMKFAANIEYGLVCIGANDRSMTSAQLINGLTTIAEYLKSFNIKPVIFTIAPCDFSKNGNWKSTNFVEANVWIRNSEYQYVDMEQVFIGVDASTGTWTNDDVLTSLYLEDRVHPNKSGHALIFKRIKTDCPYLFNSFSKGRVRPTSGTWANRPQYVDLVDDTPGYAYFCTDKNSGETGALNGMMIYYQGINGGSIVWVDALGRVVQ